MSQHHWIIRKKVPLSMIASVLLLSGGGYWYYASNKSAAAETRYITATPERGLFITSLSGTGQVSSQNQIDVHSKVGGDITNIRIKEAQAVKKGDILLTIDAREAQKSVRDAQHAVYAANANVQSAQISLAKLKQPPLQSAIIQAENALNQAKRDLEDLLQPPDALDVRQAESQIANAEQSVKLSSDGKTPQTIRNAYDTAVGTLRTAAEALHQTVVDADSILGVENKTANMEYATLLSIQDSNQRLQANGYYGTAKIADAAMQTTVGNLALQNEDPAHIDAALTEMQSALEKASTMTASVTKALRASLTSSSFTQNELDQLISSMESAQSLMTSKSSSILSQIQSIIQSKNTYESSKRSLEQAKISLEKLTQPPEESAIAAAKEKIREREQALTELKAGPTSSDLALSQNTIAQRNADLQAARNTLTDKLQVLEDYTVRAPFDGIIAKLSVHDTDTISSNATVATLITHQKIADIALNEVDAAKVRSGQKATITFDAIDDLSITGSVEEVSPLGTVTQGVVNYTVKIIFDTQDSRVKAGMSARASIILSSNPDVLMIPNAAVKSQNGQSYVEILDSTSITTSTQGGVTSSVSPRRQTIEVGEVNDTHTEIKNGLTGNELVITQTINTTTAKSSSSAPKTNAGLGLPGLSTGGGNAGFRIQAPR